MANGDRDNVWCWWQPTMLSEAVKAGLVLSSSLLSNGAQGVCSRHQSIQKLNMGPVEAEMTES